MGSRLLVVAIVLRLATPLLYPLPADAEATCLGDCNEDGVVTINEITRCVGVMLAIDSVISDPCCEHNGSGITIGSIIQAVNNALNGCPDRAIYCVGFHDPACGQTEICDMHDEACALRLPVGTCVPKPDSCPDIHEPVCGCDNVTYKSDCERLRAREVQQAEGPCEVFSCCPQNAFFPGQIIMVFQSGTTRQRVEEIIAQLDGTLLYDFEYLPEIYVVRVPPGREIELASAASQFPEVASASVSHVLCLLSAAGCGCCPPGLTCPGLAPCVAQ